MTHCKMSSRGDREKAQGTEELHSLAKHKRERDNTLEALVLLRQLKLIRYLWRGIMLALDTEFKSLKKPLPKVFNNSLLKAR